MLEIHDDFTINLIKVCSRIVTIKGTLCTLNQKLGGGDNCIGGQFSDTHHDIFKILW